MTKLIILRIKFKNLPIQLCFENFQILEKYSKTTDFSKSKLLCRRTSCNALDQTHISLFLIQFFSP